MILIAFNHLLK